MQEEKNEKLGFLTVVEDQKSGLFGGYLVLNSAGRPLEFHCTAPVKPTRAQEILYGPTLKSYLYGEQIGKTLLDHAGRLEYSIDPDGDESSLDYYPDGITMSIQMIQV